MKLGGVHHVSIDVVDLETAGKFYVDMLGLEPIARPELGFPGLWFRSGAQELHLVQVESHQAPQGQHFAFRVDDLQAAVAELHAKGVRVSRLIDIPGGVGQQAFLRDPAGNLLELNQPRL